MPGMGAWVPGMEGSEEQQPGWVLQSMVPSVLLHGRKIHLRTYVIALRAPTAAAAARTGDAAAAAAAAEAADCPWPNSGLEFYAYQRHEVRLAAAAMSDDLTGEKTALFAPFIYKNDHFSKTGSGQT